MVLEKGFQNLGKLKWTLHEVLTNIAIVEAKGRKLIHVYMELFKKNQFIKKMILRLVASLSVQLSLIALLLL